MTDPPRKLLQMEFSHLQHFLLFVCVCDCVCACVIVCCVSVLEINDLQKEFLFKTFCGLGLEMLQNGFLGASCAHSAAWAWKC